MHDVHKILFIDHDVTPKQHPHSPSTGLVSPSTLPLSSFQPPPPSHPFFHSQHYPSASSLPLSHSLDYPCLSLSLHRSPPPSSVSSFILSKPSLFPSYTAPSILHRCNYQVIIMSIYCMRVNGWVGWRPGYILTSCCRRRGVGVRGREGRRSKKWGRIREFYTDSILKISFGPGVLATCSPNYTRFKAWMLCLIDIMNTAIGKISWS